MGSTGAPYNLPWPDPTSSPDVPRDMETLARAVAAALGAMNSNIIGTLQGAFPGEIRMLGYSGAPTNWLECDGRLVKQTQYPTLFAAIGHNFADGRNPPTGDFYLPDFSDTFPHGIVPGKRGGANSLTLAAANIPSHAHSISHGHSVSVSPSSHTHTVTARERLPANQEVPQTNRVSGGGGTYNLNQNTAVNSSSHGHSASVGGHSGNSGSYGSGQAFDNRPKYTGVMFVIYAGQ